MKVLDRRFASVLFASAMVVGLAAPAFAQLNPAPNGPAGGVGSTTAPSNSQGTPSGGTGVISTTVAPAAPVATAAPPAPTTRRIIRRRRVVHHPVHPVPAPSTTSQ